MNQAKTEEFINYQKQVMILNHKYYFIFLIFLGDCQCEGCGLRPDVSWLLCAYRGYWILKRVLGLLVGKRENLSF